MVNFSRTYTENEYNSIINYNGYSNDRFPKMFKLYGETGMRLSEGFYGVLTEDNNGIWFIPEIPDDALIVNAGQFLGRWSNDRFRATPHRVVPPRKNDRYSLACFVNPNFEAIGECLPTCQSNSNPAKYPTQTYREFFNWYMTNTFTHYGKLKEVDGKTVEIQ